MSCTPARALPGLALLLLAGCPASGSLVDAGGPVTGPVDNHCYTLPDGSYPGGPFTPTQVLWFTCPLQDGGFCMITLPDGADGGPCPPYGATEYNSGGNDDDCKYQVSWWSTPIQYNPGGANATCETGPCVTFYVAANYAWDGTPLTGNPDTASANNQMVTEVEANSGNGLPPPNIGAGQMTMIQPGVFQSVPMALNAHGRWQIRFHFNEECLDSWPNSPHGHTAFYFDVP